MSSKKETKGRIRKADFLEETVNCSDGYDNSNQYNFVQAAKKKVNRNLKITGRPTGSEPRPSSSTSATQGLVHFDPPMVQTHVEPIVQSKVDFFERDDQFLNFRETYKNLLCEQNGIWCTDNTYTSFVLLDFSEDSRSLQKRHFLFLSRLVKSFLDLPMWVYKCSCDKDRSAFIDCLSIEIDKQFDEFVLESPWCKHVQVARDILESVDGINNIQPLLEGDEILEDDRLDEVTPERQVVSQLNVNLFCVTTPRGPGVVERKDVLTCHTCNASKVLCHHISAFQQHEDTTEYEARNSDSVAYQPRCYSVCSIPFCATAVLQDVYNLNLSERVAKLKSAFETQCNICQDCGKDCSTYEMTRTFVTVSGTSLVEVASKKCQACGTISQIEGFELGAINLGKYIVCHEVLRRYMHYFLTGRSTIWTEYTVLKSFCEDLGNSTFSTHFTYNQFRWAWYAFLYLLDIDFDSCFVCPDCGDDPDTFVMDATSVAFRKELSSWSMFSNQSHSLPPPDHDRQRVEKRVFLPKKLRSIISSYASDRADTSSVNQFLYEIETVCPKASSFFNIIFKMSTTNMKGLLCCPPNLRNLLKDLGSSYPVCSFISTNKCVHAVLKKICLCDITKDADAVKMIQFNIPSLFRALPDFDNDLTKSFGDIVPILIEKAMSPFEKDNQIYSSVEAMNDCSFFPSMPILRERGLYSADRKSLMEASCSKRSKGHPSLLPGVFTLFCKHGICYGFEVMRIHESPNVPFSILRRRCSKAPNLVVYDNACNLSIYCLNRDPEFFRHTSFRVDALHYKNHKACGPSYELKSYPQHKNLNSQVVEQSNSRLQRIKSQVSYMTRKNFMIHCKFFLWKRNKDLVFKMYPESEINPRVISDTI